MMMADESSSDDGRQEDDSPAAAAAASSVGAVAAATEIPFHPSIQADPDVEKGLAWLKSMGLVEVSDAALRTVLDANRDGQGAVSLEIVVHRLISEGLYDQLKAAAETDGVGAAASGSPAPSGAAGEDDQAAEGPRLTDEEEAFLASSFEAGQVDRHVFLALPPEQRKLLMDETQWDGEDRQREKAAQEARRKEERNQRRQRQQHLQQQQGVAASAARPRAVKRPRVRQDHFDPGTGPASTWNEGASDPASDGQDRQPRQPATAAAAAAAAATAPATATATAPATAAPARRTKASTTKKRSKKGVEIDDEPCDHTGRVALAWFGDVWARGFVRGWVRGHVHKWVWWQSESATDENEMHEILVDHIVVLSGCPADSFSEGDRVQAEWSDGGQYHGYYPGTVTSVATGERISLYDVDFDDGGSVFTQPNTDSVFGISYADFTQTSEEQHQYQENIRF
jgi:hypothetical protein